MDMIATAYLHPLYLLAHSVNVDLDLAAHLRDITSCLGPYCDNIPAECQRSGCALGDGLTESPAGMRGALRARPECVSKNLLVTYMNCGFR